MLQAIEREAQDKIVAMSVKGKKLEIILAKLLIGKDRDQTERFIQKAQFLGPKCAQTYRELALLALLAKGSRKK